MEKLLRILWKSEYRNTKIEHKIFNVTSLVIKVKVATIKNIIPDVTIFFTETVFMTRISVIGNKTPHVTNLIIDVAIDTKRSNINNRVTSNEIK